MSRETARKVLEIEADAIRALIPRLDASFDRAVELLLGTAGRVVVTGMGKSGIIAQKISATLASIGTPSLYLHPADAIHGGWICPLCDQLRIDAGEQIAELVESRIRFGSSGQRVDRAACMKHRRILERPHDVAQRIHVLQLAQPLLTGLRVFRRSGRHRAFDLGVFGPLRLVER